MTSPSARRSPEPNADAADPPPPAHAPLIDRATLTRILVAAVALVGVFFAAQLTIRLSNLWLLIFGSVLVAVILRSIADPLVRRTPLNDELATLVAVLLVVAIFAAIGTLFGQTISAQITGLAQRLPADWETLRARVEASPIGDQLLGFATAIGSQAGRALIIAQRIATAVLSGVTTMVLVLVAGIFIALRPREAREGALAMVPLSARPRLREVMNTCGRALKGWLHAQLISMVVVGSLVTLGLWVIGVPSPLALGLLSGMAQFVPIVGPIVSAVPALLVAAVSGQHTALLTLALYIGVSQLEANLITPLVQRNVAALPVVLGIFAVVAMGILFGPLGVLFATPAALVIYTAVTLLYRQDVLGDPDAVAPGQLPPRRDA
ncbi:AI-2E family transporter [Phenylobacterium sp. LjRoot219]|uniref:AI-2E family transporter n=1 Tax=Phenylobacterium sp. LjRoot219 TaxID=3342283 RepID=UPI003ECD1A4D